MSGSSFLLSVCVRISRPRRRSSATKWQQALSFTSRSARKSGRNSSRRRGSASAPTRPATCRYTRRASTAAAWFDLENADGVYRITDFDEASRFDAQRQTDAPVYCDLRRRRDQHRRHDISFSFFSLDIEILADHDQSRTAAYRAVYRGSRARIGRFAKTRRRKGVSCANSSASFRARSAGRPS